MEEHILFSKIQQGDAASFEWLYKKYHPRTVSYTHLSCSPAYHCTRMAGICSFSHAMAKGFPVTKTSTTGFPVAWTACINFPWAPVRERSVRSKPSPQLVSW